MEVLDDDVMKNLEGIAWAANNFLPSQAAAEIIDLVNKIKKNYIAGYYESTPKDCGTGTD